MKSVNLIMTILIISHSFSYLIVYHNETFPVSEDPKPTISDMVTQSELPSKINFLSSQGNVERFLPASNLTVSEYLDNSFMFTFNASIRGINSSHWIVDGEYGKPVDFFEKLYPTSFQASVNRTSINHSYPAQNYYNWFGQEQNTFDYWIDTTGFYEGYVYNSGGINMTVMINETVTLPGIGTFNSWHIEGTDPVFGLIVTRYSSFGMFIDFNFTYTSNFYYNLTRVELHEVPPGYTGPSLDSLTPANGSVLPPGSLIEPSFYSQYGLATIYYQCRLVFEVVEADFRRCVINNKYKLSYDPEIFVSVYNRNC